MQYHLEYDKIFSRRRAGAPPSAAAGANPDRGTPQSRYYEYVVARDTLMIKLAYAYEQATHHRIPPKTTPGARQAHDVQLSNMGSDP